MLKEFINYHTNKDANVLDFFAGSGSTGHAVLDLNSEDG
jgi:adenine-specific DNA-methyltransferase